MVYYRLKITADLHNLTKLQPMGGADNPNFGYCLKMKCGGCGELTKKAICVSVKEEVSIKCKFCERVGIVTVMSGKGRPLTQEHSAEGEYTPLIKFECMGYDPVDFVFGTGWKAESIAGTVFEDIDLSGGEFAEYDDKGECPVMIYNLRSSIEVTMSEQEEYYHAVKLRMAESTRRWVAVRRANKKLNAFYH